MNHYVWCIFLYVLAVCGTFLHLTWHFVVYFEVFMFCTFELRKYIVHFVPVFISFAFYRHKAISEFTVAYGRYWIAEEKTHFSNELLNILAQVTMPFKAPPFHQCIFSKFNSSLVISCTLVHSSFRNSLILRKIIKKYIFKIAINFKKC